MAKPIYAIYGASGCGRSLMPVARQQLQRDGLTAELYFIDDRFDQPTVWNGHPAVNYATFQQITKEFSDQDLASVFKYAISQAYLDGGMLSDRHIKRALYNFLRTSTQPPPPSRR